MKWVFLLSFFTRGGVLSGQSLERQQLREGFLESTQRKSALDSFIKKLQVIQVKSPAQECYYGICLALLTEQTNGIVAKIKLVNQSKDILNHSIARDPRDPELRFIRLTLEHYLPAFLGMSKEIPCDLAIIFANPDFFSDNPSLKKKALEFLLATHRCTPEQNNLLLHQLAELNKKTFNGLALTTSR
ncbi:MAG: hypothetical protein JWO06_3175 [Bacteroidota bacterium]|nr:hypothetical protein [Bacteroidota bacterium]